MGLTNRPLRVVFDSKPCVGASCDPSGFEPYLRYPAPLSDLWCILCGTNTSRLEAGSVEGCGGEVWAKMPEGGATAFGVRNGLVNEFRTDILAGRRQRCD